MRRAVDEDGVDVPVVERALGGGASGSATTSDGSSARRAPSQRRREVGRAGAASADELRLGLVESSAVGMTGPPPGSAAVTIVETRNERSRTRS